MFLEFLMTPCFQQVEVCTVDGFQGREKEAIVISMVRSNDAGEIGLLGHNHYLVVFL